VKNAECVGKGQVNIVLQPDGGVGEFPTDTKIGASFSNANPSLYKENIKARARQK
jgi:hypothetical protein